MKTRSISARSRTMPPTTSQGSSGCLQTLRVDIIELPFNQAPRWGISTSLKPNLPRLRTFRTFECPVALVVGVYTLHNVEMRWPDEEYKRLRDSLARDFPDTTRNFVRAMFREDADPALVASITADMAAAPPWVALSAIEELKYYDEAQAIRLAGAPVVCNNAGLLEEGGLEGVIGGLLGAREGVGGCAGPDQPFTNACRISQSEAPRNFFRRSERRNSWYAPFSE
jgi:hypothetical protein